MSSTPEQQLADSMISALALQWEDNGNASADAIRDYCVSALASYLGKTFDEVLALVDQRLDELQ